MVKAANSEASILDVAGDSEASILDKAEDSEASILDVTGELEVSVFGVTGTTRLGNLGKPADRTDTREVSSIPEIRHLRLELAILWASCGQRTPNCKLWTLDWRTSYE